MENRACIICQKLVNTNSKTCSVECRKRHNSNRNKNRTKTTIKCLVCLNSFTTIKKDAKFCSISCSSKFYIQNGNYNKFKEFKLQKNGIMQKCGSLLCDNTVYYKPHQIGKIVKYCSMICKNRGVSVKNSGKNNPFFGKKLTFESDEKRKNTLLKNHGVTHPFMLLRNYKISKPQKEIADFLKEKKYNITLEYQCKINDKMFYIDIFVHDFNIAIEYNGDYWHCNPSVYLPEYFHPKKKTTASLIWKKDEERSLVFKTINVETIIVWEKDYKQNKELSLLKLIEEIKILMENKKKKILMISDSPLTC